VDDFKYSIKHLPKTGRCHYFSPEALETKPGHEKTDLPEVAHFK
jgi:hypothetical protein